MRGLRMSTAGVGSPTRSTQRARREGWRTRLPVLGQRLVVGCPSASRPRTGEDEVAFQDEARPKPSSALQALFALVKRAAMGKMNGDLA